MTLSEMSTWTQGCEYHHDNGSQLGYLKMSMTINLLNNIPVFPAAEESDQLFQLPPCPGSRRADPEERKHVSL